MLQLMANATIRFQVGVLIIAILQLKREGFPTIHTKVQLTRDASNPATGMAHGLQYLSRCIF
jgi:hypothetical protein